MNILIQGCVELLCNPVSPLFNYSVENTNLVTGLGLELFTYSGFNDTGGGVTGYAGADGMRTGVLLILLRLLWLLVSQIVTVTITMIIIIIITAIVSGIITVIIFVMTNVIILLLLLL